MPVAPAPSELDESRRDRKKRETREALVEAAIALFAEQGVEATSVEQIADRVDVSARTFHRYFATKDDVLFADTDVRQAKFARALAARPAEEPLLASIRAAALELVAELTASPEHEARRVRLIESTDSLRARSLAVLEVWASVVAEHAAARLGLSPTDALPRLLGSCSVSALRTARKRWHEDPRIDLAEEYARCFDLLADLSAAVDEGPARRSGRRR